MSRPPEERPRDREREVIVTDGGRGGGGAGAVIAAVVGVILILVVGWFLLNMLGIMERGTDDGSNGVNVELEMPDAPADEGGDTTDDGGMTDDTDDTDTTDDDA